MIRYAEKLQPVMLYEPKSTTLTDTETAHVKLKNAQWVTFMVYWGARTSNAVTGGGNIRVYSSSAATTTSAVAQPFKYRLSSVMGGSTWGAISDATTAGYTLSNPSTDGTIVNQMLLIDIDPAVIRKNQSGANYAHVWLSPVADGSNVMGVFAFVEPRFPQNANLSTT
jgi:hypothetical protein